MIKGKVLKGVLFVVLGATSYGMLATFVRMAYNEGYTTAEATTSQFAIGILGLLAILLFKTKVKKQKLKKATRKEMFSLLIAGLSTGMTSIFYYLAVRYIPVSIGIVLLMQTVWIGVIVEMIVDGKKPGIAKIVAVMIVLIGTLMATNLINADVHLDWRGVLLGLLAAVSFTTTMFASNKIAIRLAPIKRSLFMIMGGALVVFVFGLFTQVDPYNFQIFLKWGFVLALFGTIIPPILMNLGFPLCGIGLGSIVSSAELPVSVLMAYMFLHERVTAIQWLGILLIILAIIIMNLRLKNKLATK